MNTIELHCIIHADRKERLEISDILVAQLSELGYQSFMDDDFGLKAYIPQEKFDAASLDELPILTMFPGKIEWKQQTIADKNWNAEWEKSFQPVVVADQCLIRAPFHEKNESYPYEIIVEPKMSFGTGHHYTTSLMIKWILELDLKNQKVLDMGSGTGILAILSSMKGAAKVWAIDHDDWAYQNAKENVTINRCDNIRVIQGTANSLQGECFDLILANINLNILMQDIPEYIKSLNPNGKLIISGIYDHDMKKIKTLTTKQGLKFLSFKEDNHWVSIAYQKS